MFVGDGSRAFPRQQNLWLNRKKQSTNQAWKVPMVTVVKRQLAYRRRKLRTAIQLTAGFLPIGYEERLADDMRSKISRGEKPMLWMTWIEPKRHRGWKKLIGVLNSAKPIQGNRTFNPFGRKIDKPGWNETMVTIVKPQLDFKCCKLRSASELTAGFSPVNQSRDWNEERLPERQMTWGRKAYKATSLYYQWPEQIKKDIGVMTPA